MTTLRDCDEYAATVKQTWTIEQNYDQDTPVDSEMCSSAVEETTTGMSRRWRKRNSSSLSRRGLLLALLSAPSAMAQCLPLKGSQACSAWQSSSVATKEGRAVELLYVDYTSISLEFL
jgi:hypothetical protein